MTFEEALNETIEIKFVDYLSLLIWLLFAIFIICIILIKKNELKNNYEEKLQQVENDLIDYKISNDILTKKLNNFKFYNKYIRRKNDFNKENIK